MNNIEERMLNLVYNYIENEFNVDKDMLDDQAVELIDKYDLPDNSGFHAVVRAVVEGVMYFAFDYNSNDKRWYCEVYCKEDWFEVGDE